MQELLERLRETVVAINSIPSINLLMSVYLIYWIRNMGVWIRDILGLKELPRKLSMDATLLWERLDGRNSDRDPWAIEEWGEGVSASSNMVEKIGKNQIFLFTDMFRFLFLRRPDRIC